jgi:hypothetical protein
MKTVHILPLLHLLKYNNYIYDLFDDHIFNKIRKQGYKSCFVLRAP